MQPGHDPTISPASGWRVVGFGIYCRCFIQPGHDPNISLASGWRVVGFGTYCRCFMQPVLCNLATTLLFLQLRVGEWWGLVYTVGVLYNLATTLIFPQLRVGEWWGLVHVLCNLADTQLISPASGWRVVDFGIQCRCRWPCVQYVSPASPGRTIVLDLSTDIPLD